MFYHSFLTVLFLNNAVSISSAFSFAGWGGSSQQSQPMAARTPTGSARTGAQWGRPAQKPIVLPCDGSPEITRACDTFCKSIRAAEGACVPGAQTCGCTGGSLAPATSTTSGGVSPQAPPESMTGIHVVDAPDLSQNTPSPDTTGTTAQAGHSRKKRRTKRQGTGNIVEGSGPKDPANLCTKDSCSRTCADKGYASCSAECVGLSCYCRCP